MVRLLCLGLMLGLNSTMLAYGKKDHRVLDLTGQKVDETTIFQQPNEIRILILDSCFMTELPIAIASLSNLEHLSLKNNPGLDLNQMMEVIKDLPELTFLNLSNNQIRVLPQSMNRLEITDLRLSHNAIDLNQSISILRVLPHLKRLWIDNNQLQIFPNSLLNFQHLQVLYAYSNDLSSIDLTDRVNTSLWVLHLGNNEFRELPQALTLMKGLRMALFNQNKIISIPTAFGQSKYSMNALILDSNPLDKESRNRGTRYFKKMMMYSAK